MQIMFRFLLIIFISCCSAQNNVSLGYVVGQYYSRMRLYEYSDYSTVRFFKFDVHAPTTLANWSITISTDGRCSDYPANIHFYLQHGAYPLISPLNESFPDAYVTARHDLIVTIFDRLVSNGTVQLRNPLRGTWFAMSFVEKLSKDTKSKTPSNCNIYLTTWLDYQAMPVILTLTLSQQLQITLSTNTPFAYASYYTSMIDSRLVVLSDWYYDCNVTILGRINGLPSLSQYDYRTVCNNGSCSIQIESLAAFLWIYFQISVNDLTCLNNTIRGSMFINSTECSSALSNTNDVCLRPYPTRRIMFNYYYEMIYIPTRIDSRNNSIVMTSNDSSIYAYEFIVDDRNIGGTIHFDFETKTKPYVPSNTNMSILGCLSKHQPRRYDRCESDYRIYIRENFLTVRSLPYPEMAVWYLTLEYNCNDSISQCTNASMSVTFQISSSSCTRQQCGTYGTCKILTSQQNIFSTCICIAGYRGYGCTDSSQSYVSKYLPSVLFLTISNLMFMPAVILAVYYGLYIEALVYFFNMFFSTFYHACDQAIYNFCMFKYDGLQLSDFIGSYSSFVVTLITMSIIPRSIKAFLFMLGVLTCVTINSRDRFDSLQFIALISITSGFTILTWILVSIKSRRLQPAGRQLLLTVPGIILAIVGIILFTAVQTEDNYWYIHSLWHIFMASSILFLLPRKLKRNKRELQSDNERNRTTLHSPLSIINGPTIVPSSDQRDSSQETNE